MLPKALTAILISSSSIIADPLSFIPSFAPPLPSPFSPENPWIVGSKGETEPAPRPKASCPLFFLALKEEAFGEMGWEVDPPDSFEVPEAEAEGEGEEEGSGGSLHNDEMDSRSGDWYGMVGERSLGGTVT